MPRPRTTDLSQVHERILLELRRQIDSGGVATVSELAAGLKLAGVTSLVPTLKIMERNGFVRIVGGGTRGTRRTVVFTTKGRMAAGDGGVPVLGFIPAGPLSEVLAHCEEVLDLGTILPYQAGDFLLVVNGQSMIGDGILPGDKVLLRPDVQVQNGEIAAVHFGDQYLATLKHVCFQSDNKIITLRASNEKYPDVNVPGRELQIVGVFRGLVRTI